MYRRNIAAAEHKPANTSIQSRNPKISAMPIRKSKNSTTVTPKVAEAVNESKEVTREIEHAAHDLAVAHAVLEKNIPDTPTSEDVSGAVKRTAEVQKKLDKTAKKLETVTEKLEGELKDSTGKK